MSLNKDQEEIAYYIIGLMSGSSLDGLDIAYCFLEEVDDRISWDLLAYETIPLPPSIVEQLQAWKKLDSLSLIELESEFSLFVSEVLNTFISEKCQQLDLIVSHGHTLYHHPTKTISKQIGSGGVISAKTGYPVLCDLRIQDVSLGGQGAPLASLIDTHFFSQYSYALNIGGIANVSMQTDGAYKAFDICAANQVLNHLANRSGEAYDSGGDMARTGVEIQNFEAYLENAYYKQKAPKSLDNDWVKQHVINSLPEDKVEDLLNSYCHFIANQVRSAVLQEDDEPQGKTMMVSGGGTKNTYLFEVIQSTLKSIGVAAYESNEEIVDYKESLLMALMGFLFLNGKTNVLSEITGASMDLSAGAFYQGSKHPFQWTKTKE